MNQKTREIIHNVITQLEYGAISTADRCSLDCFEKLFVERALADLYSALNIDALLKTSNDKATNKRDSATKEKEKKINGDNKT